MTLIAHEFMERAIAHRDDHLRSLLKDKGPGWAVGFRVKTEEGVRRADNPAEVAYFRIEWEYHVMPLVKGQLPHGMFGFHYVTLKEFQDA